MPGNEAGLNLLGILERLSNVLIKADANGGNPLTADKDLISLGGSKLKTPISISWNLHSLWMEMQ